MASTKQVQALIAAALAERRYEQGNLPGVRAADAILRITISGNDVVVTFGDGATARLDITITPAPEGSQE